jgi:hypothetical protein
MGLVAWSRGAARQQDCRHHNRRNEPIAQHCQPQA